MQRNGISKLYNTLGGGIEPGDTIQQTLAKELQEETGYVDFRVIAELGSIKAYFKDEKCSYERISHGFLIILNSDKNIGLSLTEHEIEQQLQVVWKNQNEATEAFEIGIKSVESLNYHYEFLKRSIKFLEENKV